MSRRNLRFAVVLGTLAALAGCETWKRSGLRSKDEPAPPYTLPDEEEAEAKKPAGLKGFFKPTRLPGALSSEGAEVERSLGIP